MTLTARLTRILLCLLLAVAAVQAGRIYLIAAQLEGVHSWQWVDTAVAERHMQKAEAYSNDMRASVAATAAQYWESRYLNSPAGSAGADDFLANAHHYYGAAVELRPHDAHLLAGLVSVLSHQTSLGKTVPGREFAGFYQRAAQLGPYESAVQYRLVLTGFRHFLSLPADLRPMAVSVAKRGLQHPSLSQQKRIAELLQNEGYLQIVCAQSESVSIFCPKM